MELDSSNIKISWQPALLEPCSTYTTVHNSTRSISHPYQHRPTEKPKLGRNNGISESVGIHEHFAHAATARCGYCCRLPALECICPTHGKEVQSRSKRARKARIIISNLGQAVVHHCQCFHSYFRLSFRIIVESWPQNNSVTVPLHRRWITENNQGNLTV